MKDLRWRVIYGYKLNDYTSINEEFLEKATLAFITGGILKLPNGKKISGKEIKRIEPDIRYYTGWYDNYEYGRPEDTRQIARLVPERRLEERSDLADKRVRYAITKNNTELLNRPEQIDSLLLN